MTNPASTLAEANPKKCESSETTLAVDNFLAAIAPARRPTTLRGYAQELKTWARYAEAVRTPELAAAAKDWPDYWAFRCARTSAQSWRTLALAHRHFWTWAIETHRAETSPVKTIFLPKRRTSTRLPPNETDFAKLIQPDHPIGTRGLCDHAMITLLAETGARVGEICGMKIADTDIKGKTATVTLKGGKPGTIYMGDGAARAVTQWLQNGRPKVKRPASPDNLLLSQRGTAMTSEDAARRIAHYCRARGLKPITAHQLRHRFACNLLAAGATLPEVQTLMNHKNLASTLVYLHTTEAQARAAHARLSPGQKK